MKVSLEGRIKAKSWTLSQWIRRAFIEKFPFHSQVTFLFIIQFSCQINWWKHTDNKCALVKILQWSGKFNVFIPRCSVKTFHQSCLSFLLVFKISSFSLVCHLCIYYTWSKCTYLTWEILWWKSVVTESKKGSRSESFEYWLVPSKITKASRTRCVKCYPWR